VREPGLLRPLPAAAGDPVPVVVGRRLDRVLPAGLRRGVPAAAPARGAAERQHVAGRSGHRSGDRRRGSRVRPRPGPGGQRGQPRASS
jgi:hypothetical protein